MVEDNVLVLCRRALMKIAVRSTENSAEKMVARFYLNELKKCDEKWLHNQSGFGRGIGGHGDNMIFMPVVERKNNQIVLDDEGHLKTTKCVFDDFKSYLKFIQTRQDIQQDMQYRRILPHNLNGLPADDYIAIWNRQRCLAD